MESNFRLSNFDIPNNESGLPVSLVNGRYFDWKIYLNEITHILMRTDILKYDIIK
jgi:hypothetical protein